MKCYYEILEIPRSADDGEIKIAYRKLALRWHPDKNLDTPDFAKEQFQLVQQAYEVLSDRQERAWYDNHREQILRGSNSEYEDNCLDVFPYFTTQCFKGYGDDKQGFYSVYRKVFEQISHEDIEHMDSKSDLDEIPSFGFSSSDYDDIVGPFYSYWMSYNTKKSYVWLDPYNINETRDRRVGKIIEKENKKVRQKAKKERNEEIRNLVAFVRKRDKRVQAYVKQLETKNRENREKQELIRKQKLLERQKELKSENSQAEWSKFDNVKSELKQIEKNLAEQFGECLSDSDSTAEEENEANNLYCAACNKIFKTCKAFENHESSKKHKENVVKLKIQLQNDDIEEISHKDLMDSDVDTDDLFCKPCNKPFKTTKALENHQTSKKHIENLNKLENDKKNTNETSQEESFELISESEITNDLEISKTSNKKSKRGKKVINNHLNNLPSDSGSESVSKEINGSDNSYSDFDFNKTKKQKKKYKLKSQTSVQNKENSENSVNQAAIQNEAEAEADVLPGNLENKTKKSKKKKVIDKDEEGNKNVEITLRCATCKSIFESKNKLFQHLKQSKHQIPLPDAPLKKKKAK